MALMDKIITRSNWEVTGSSGVTVAVGLPVIDLSAGVATLKLPLENRTTKPRGKITLKGKGAGIEAGVTMGFPISISGSTDSFPSDGIGKIYSGFLAPRNRAFRARDFLGHLTVISFGGTLGVHNACLNLAVWTNQHFQECMSSFTSCNLSDFILLAGKARASIPGGPLVSLAYGSKALALYWGINLSSEGASLGGTAYHFVMKS